MFGGVKRNLTVAALELLGPVPVSGQFHPIIGLPGGSLTPDHHSPFFATFHPTDHLMSSLTWLRSRSHRPGPHGLSWWLLCLSELTGKVVDPVQAFLRSGL